MFTGLVAERGLVRRVDERKDATLVLEIEARRLAADLKPGDSIAVDGVCLTATKVKRRRFVVDVVPETVAKTTLRALRADSEVNLELPPTAGERLGGHLVQGHVDGVATVLRVEPEAESRRLWLEPDQALMRYIVTKGSISVNGVSLTVATVGRASFNVVLVPHTLTVTTLGRLDVGDQVNIEVDVVAKYVERLVQAQAHDSPAATAR